MTDDRSSNVPSFAPPVPRGAATGPRMALVVTLLLMLAGCRTTNFFRPPGPPAPVVLQPAATTEQIIAAVNQNTARIRSYSTNTAKMSVPGMAGLPLLRGNIALERPNRFRMTAGTAVTGSELDLGSNDELLWFWVKRNVPAALYYSRHDQFAHSAARQMLPVDPTWIGDALGLVELNPDAFYEGPFPRNDGSLELRSPISTPTGPMTRVVVVNPTHAWVVEQHLYDNANGVAGGPPVASAIAEDFRYDPATQVSLPRRVTVRVPTADLALTIDVGEVAVNAPLATTLWSMPVMEGVPRVDLGSTTPGVPLDFSSIPQSASPAYVPLSAPAPTAIAPVQYQSESPPATTGLPAGGIALSPTAAVTQ